MTFNRRCYVDSSTQVVKQGSLVPTYQLLYCKISPSKLSPPLKLCIIDLLQNVCESDESIADIRMETTVVHFAQIKRPHSRVTKPTYFLYCD
jgi:hypothetical protein